MNASTNYQSIPTALISAPAHQLRDSIDPGALGELADSMAAEGLHQPIGVRGPLPDGTYEVVWGHRRLLAARLLSWDSIPARTFAPTFDPLLASVSENLQRTDLNPLEEAHAIQRFVERGQPIVAIARLFRRSDAWIRERLLLLGLPDDLQRAVALRTVPLAVVRVLSEIDHAEYRRELIAEAARTGATAATAEVWRAHYLSDRERILGNRLAVQQIITDRATFVITYPCDWCGALHPYELTVSWRFCKGCDEQLDRAKLGGSAKPG